MNEVELTDMTGRIEKMPAETYHGMKSYLGSSTLAEMRKSPRHFKSAWETSMEATDAMKRGTFMHDVILAQDLSPYIARPLKPDGSLVRANSNEFKEFLAVHKDRVVVEPELLADTNEMLESVRAHNTFMEMYEMCKAEVSFFGTAYTGQKIKARCDLVPDLADFILDVKTCANIDRFERDLFALAYDVRLIHYANTIRCSHLDPAYDARDLNYYFLAVESERPYGCKLFQLSDRDVEAAQETWMQWMNTVRVCREDDRWPGYSQEIITAQRPQFAERAEEPSFD